MLENQEMAPAVRAVINEIKEALKQLLETGEKHTIFISKMALQQCDREALHEVLGVGEIKITLNSNEPAEWIETSFQGVWQGVLKNFDGKPVLETIEIAFYPELAGAQKQDIEKSIQLI